MNTVLIREYAATSQRQKPASDITALLACRDYVGEILKIADAEELTTLAEMGQALDSEIAGRLARTG